MSKCCGQILIVKTYVSESVGTCVWLECPVCHKTNSYSYETQKEAEKAWDKGLVAKRA